DVLGEALGERVGVLDIALVQAEMELERFVGDALQSGEVERLGTIRLLGERCQRKPPTVSASGWTRSFEVPGRFPLPAGGKHIHIVRDLGYLTRLHREPSPLLLELEQHGLREGIPIVDRAAGRL